MQLEIKNLTFAYNKKEANIVDNFNLEVKKGEVVALVGARLWLEPLLQGQNFYF
ncbi:MAG: ABC transporter ATP-binding protein [Halanaerobium sp.]|nr:MAG: ABC transporter ATP-binding protein [Halanaerobium sp.]